MTTLEFVACLGPDHTMAVPPSLAEQIPPGQVVRVILLVPETVEEREWRRLTTEQFLKGYTDDDSPGIN